MDLRRRVPSVEQLLRQPEARALADRLGRERVLREARGLLATARKRAADGDADGLGRALDSLAEDLRSRVETAAGPSLVTVVNATGVVVHTNLGRAPLPAQAATRVAQVAAGYSNLEFDLAAGARGDREVHAETRLRALLGAEAALVVNNNAAAVLLAVNTLAEGRDVLVSRGELVEIGGSFRIPDVLRKGGARLREVGTTNRTRIADYRAALSAETALILKVHPSNFKIVGFTETPDRKQLVELARDAGLPLVEDLGSGLIEPIPGLESEPVAGPCLAAGVDVVTFSGDKLLGGPQAGLVAGRRALVDALRKNPLYRALRVDKMTMAALDAVLAEHQAGRAAQSVPVLRMLTADAAAIRARAEAFVAGLRPQAPRLGLAVVEGNSAVGGGAAPSVAIPSALVVVDHPTLSPDALAATLRAGHPPIVARVTEDRLVLDLRTVLPEQEGLLRDALAALA